jgi:uncharacterized protein YceK
MRYLASLFIVLLLAGCASLEKTDAERRVAFIEWYSNPCTKC